MAAYLEWTDSYAVGVDAFDEDHQHLIGIANKIITAADAGTQFVDVREVLDDLIEEAVVHFENEEKAMEDVDYPGLAEHREAHNQLIRTYIKYRSELKFSRLVPDDIAGFIIDWLMIHIRTEDQTYGSFLNARGIA
jgi:hemerythrin